MKRYSETKSKAPFDWNKALSKDCKDMSEKEAKKLSNLAKSWVTCACGNQCSVIPRGLSNTNGDVPKGAPIDDQLRNLGASFHDDGVNEMYMALSNYHTTSNEGAWATDKAGYLKEANKFRLKALNILKRIDKRSSILINEEINKAKETLEQFGYTIH